MISYLNDQTFGQKEYKNKVNLNTWWIKCSYLNCQIKILSSKSIIMNLFSLINKVK